MDLQRYQDFLNGYPCGGLKLDETSSTDVLKLGLMGECGEVIEKMKKGLRDGVVDSSGLKAELGDTLAYLTLILDGLGMSLHEVEAESKDREGVSVKCSLLYSARALYTAIDNFLVWGYQYEASNVITAIKRIAHTYDISFESIVFENQNKLQKRLEEGKQRGSGDNR
jgi:NTP pyrophosphatase (non-canonical NTP hydrolase)